MQPYAYCVNMILVLFNNVTNNLKYFKTAHFFFKINLRIYYYPNNNKDTACLGVDLRTEKVTKFFANFMFSL